ncbi:hypothetical protein BH10BAC2_BH10BAC2_11370 [soil metagenome]
MNNTKDQTGNVQRTKDVIDIKKVLPDDDRKESLITTDFAEALKKEVDENTPTLAAFPTEENKTDNDEPDEEKEK